MSAPPRRREALTQARRRGPIEVFGAAEPAERLRRALDVGDEALDDYTHRFHSYPARLHPATARRALAALALAPRARLVDPFCGSGTVLVEGIRAGLATSGLDASPLAVLVARAKTWAAPASTRKAFVEAARRVCDVVLAEGKAARRSGFVPARPTATDRRRQEALAGLFDPHVRREVEALRVAVGDDELLKAVLSSVLIKVSRRTSDSRGEVTPRTVPRGQAARLLADRAEELVRGVAALWKDAPRGTPHADIRLGDARALPAPDASFDAALTSPPYAGTYDYADHHGLRLTFLGLEAQRLEEREIGSRRSFQEDAAAAGVSWERDLGAALAELRRVVRPGGPILLMIGDSLAGSGPTARAVFANDTVARLASAAGLEVIAGASAPRAPLGRVEAQAFTARPKREHLIWLGSSSASDRPRPPRRSPSS